MFRTPPPLVGSGRRFDMFRHGLRFLLLASEGKLGVGVMDGNVPGWGVALQRDVVNLQADVAEIKVENTKAHDGFSTKLTDLDRALSARLPVWATFLIGGLMSVATWGLTKR